MMRASRMARASGMLALVVVVAACGPRSGQIMHIERGQTSPDEFAILPSKPIEMPQDMTALPPPTLTAGNRTDATPIEDAVAALGGNPAKTRRDGQLSSDGALIRQTTRYGVQPDIRVELAKSDIEFRRKNKGKLLERWLRVPTYYTAYERDELNQHGAAGLSRAIGLPTPAVPPEPE